MNLLKTLFFKHIYNIKNNPKELLFEIALVLISDGIMIYIWVLIFSNITTLKGYDKYHVILQYILTVGSLGIISFFCEGAKNISHYIENGHLEYFLIRPKNTLLQMIFIETSTSALSEIIFGVVLFALFFHPNLIDWGYFTSGLLVASAILLNIYLIFGLLTFFIKTSGLSQYFNFLLTFSTFPSISFQGIFFKIIFMTILPVFFYNYSIVGYISDRIHLNLWLSMLFWLLTTFLVIITYRIGIKRYTSMSNSGYIME